MVIFIFGILDDLKTDQRIKSIAKDLSIKYNVKLLINSKYNRNIKYSFNNYDVIEFKLPFKGKNNIIIFFIKQIFMIFKLFSSTNRNDLIWFFDEEVVPVAIFTFRNFIYEFHEIPHKLLNFNFSKFLLRILEKNASLILHANHSRIEYLFKTNFFF